jgi:hypothetical protein
MEYLVELLVDRLILKNSRSGAEIAAINYITCDAEFYLPSGIVRTESDGYSFRGFFVDLAGNLRKLKNEGRSLSCNGRRDATLKVDGIAFRVSRGANVGAVIKELSQLLCDFESLMDYLHYIIRH